MSFLKITATDGLNSWKFEIENTTPINGQPFKYTGELEWKDENGIFRKEMEKDANYLAKKKLQVIADTAKNFLSKIYEIDLGPNEFEKMKELAHQGLPDECVNGWDEVKFCEKRNGDGNACKLCSRYLD